MPTRPLRYRGEAGRDAIGHTEIAMAGVVLVRAATMLRDDDARTRELEDLQQMAPNRISAAALAAIEALRAETSKGPRA
jgi:hypothetical protein